MPEAVPPTVERLALSITETCEALALGEASVRELIATGELSSIRVGRRVIVPVAGLRTWIAKNAPQSPGDGNGAPKGGGADMTTTADSRRHGRTI